MKVLQTNSFKRVVKKLKNNEKKALDEAVKQIIDDPEIGEQKSGNLRHVWVYKYKLKVMLYLLAYSYNEEEITFLAVGFHENFYRDLKKTQ
ncbi:MAG: type II toxin-antitoxin system RelE/ParE family toxin [Gammaproteobacteria bacterium]|nr:MAG: type II toxin-antitoxin system RelE/ParE family toxin [Gammaproteobacteria bacterium]